jgi:hypothetical protein
MLAISMLSWWYEKGWATVLNSFKKRNGEVLAYFSVTTLLRTLFSPWRRIISLPGQSLKSHVNAAIDNSISRVIGFIVRLIILFMAVITLVLVSLFSFIEMIVWPFMPPAFVILLVIGVIKL